MSSLKSFSRNLKNIFKSSNFSTKLQKDNLENLEKSQLFDVDFYISNNNLNKMSRQDAFKHYLSEGWRKQLDPHPLFRTEYYLLQTGPLNEPALLHYLRAGYASKHSPHPLFDAEFYYKQRPDVKEKGVNPLKHYLEYGARENTSPSEFFDQIYYLRTYPQIAASEMNPLVHYILHGENARLNPSRSFTTREYLRANPDLAETSIGLLEHYVLHGQREGRPLRSVHRAQMADTQMASLSVVIPTYDRAALLRETLELCQEHAKSSDIEFIVIDDGSHDDTAAVLEEMAERYENITYKSVKNGGPGHARNVGAALARKDVVLFLGDDIQPVNSEFFETHARLHGTYRSPRFAVLGKCVWPDANKIDVNHVMRHVQGRGGEQFGYADFTPYTFLDWRFFYTANVSVKRVLIDDWERNGFSSKFNLYGFEDVELAYRLTQEPGGFTIFYDPTSIGHHIHPYTVDGFIKRQFNAGMMAEVFLQLHDVTEALGLQAILGHLRATARPDDAAIVSDCLSILDGIKAWTRVLDRGGGLGREAWHDDLLSAVFEASFYQGFITAQSRFDANLASAYQYVLSNFVSRMRRTIHHELSAAEFIHTSLFKPVIDAKSSH